jgi:hypothetical protein
MLIHVLKQNTPEHDKYMFTGADDDAMPCCRAIWRIIMSKNHACSTQTCILGPELALVIFQLQGSPTASRASNSSNSQ